MLHRLAGATVSLSAGLLAAWIAFGETPSGTSVIPTLGSVFVLSSLVFALTSSSMRRRIGRPIRHRKRRRAAHDAVKLADEIERFVDEARNDMPVVPDSVLGIDPTLRTREEIEEQVRARYAREDAIRHRRAIREKEAVQHYNGTFANRVHDLARHIYVLGELEREEAQALGQAGSLEEMRRLAFLLRDRGLQLEEAELPRTD